jgi:hypothetical protein
MRGGGIVEDRMRDCKLNVAMKEGNLQWMDDWRRDDCSNRRRMGRGILKRKTIGVGKMME